MIRKELERQFRVIDMMLTMHARLRDRYGRLARGFDVLLIVISIVVSAFVFADERVMSALGGDAEKVQRGMGMVSVLLLAASVIGVLVDWKGARERHARAAGILSHLKSETRAVLAGGEEWSVEVARERWERNTLALNGLPEVPERSFNKLKARHLCKVELSKLIDGHAGVPVWVLRLVLLWRSRRASDSREEDAGHARQRE